MFIKDSVTDTQLQELGFKKAKVYYNNQDDTVSIDIITKEVKIIRHEPKNYGPRTARIPIPQIIIKLIQLDYIK